MKPTFTARIYACDAIIDERAGNDVDELYTWMLVKAQDEPGKVRGDITNNESRKIVKSFRKCDPD